MKEQFLKDFKESGIANVPNCLLEELSEHFWVFDPVKASSNPCHIILNPTDDEKKGSIEIKNEDNKTIHFFPIDQCLIKGDTKRCDFVIFDNEKKITFCELKLGADTTKTHHNFNNTWHNAEVQLFSTLIFFRQRTDLTGCEIKFVIGMPQSMIKSPTFRQNYETKFLEIHKMRLKITDFVKV